jgi:pyruvate kinase
LYRKNSLIFLLHFSITDIVNSHEGRRRTKIVCTLGPSCWSVEGLVALIDAGMNVARFNFSHGTHGTHNACLERLREAISLRPGCHVAIMLDTKGPEIRTGMIDQTLGTKVKYTKGNTIEVGTDYSIPCTAQHLSCSYQSLPKSVKVGGKILVADGVLILKVLEIKETSVMCEVLNNASFGEKKNMNLPGCPVDLPTLTEKDIDDLRNWGIKNDVDYIAASFVRCAEDIDNIRSILGEEGKNIKIISKIENQQGLVNYDSILARGDGIMVARGDLGMEIPLEKVFIAQKMMIYKANLAGKPVVTATQMLESMITNPRPTRAECSDVANAILDGTDCVMLSGETANGDYPTEAVKMMANVCVEAESLVDYDASYDSMRRQMYDDHHLLTPTESISSSAVKTARDLGAKLIIVLTESGTAARLIAKYRPRTRVLAITPHDWLARQMNGYYKGVETQLVPKRVANDPEKILTEAITDATKRGLVSPGETVVFVYGSQSFVEGSTSSIRVVVVPPNSM